jgi:hypothetical protein
MIEESWDGASDLLILYKSRFCFGLGYKKLCGQKSKYM